MVSSLGSSTDWDAGFAPTYDFEFLVEPALFPYILPGMKIISDGPSSSHCT
jgi:hypothetical protein